MSGEPQTSLEESLSAPEKLAILEHGAERRSVCAINAMYVWLALRHEPLSLEVVEHTLTRNPVGHSLLALRHAARELGHSVQLRRCRTAAEFERLRTPAIAYGTQMSVREGILTGHYLVVHQVRDGKVRYVEPTSGGYYTTTIADFMHRVSGDFVEPGDDSFFAPSTLLWAVASFGVTGLVLTLRGRVRSSGRRRAAVAVALLVFVALCDPAHAQAPASSVSTAAQIWRASGRDTVNPLYSLLRYFDHDVSYADVCSRVATPGASLLELRDAGRAMGVDLSIVRTTPTLAMAAYLPAVAHIKHPREESGGFVLLCSVTQDGVAFFEGSGNHFAKMSWEDFLRDWSGHLLVDPSRNPSGNAPTYVALFVAAIGVYAWWRLRHRV